MRKLLAVLLIFGYHCANAQPNNLSGFLHAKFSLVPGDTFSMGSVFRLPVKDGAKNKDKFTPSATTKEMKTASAYEGWADEKPAHVVGLDSFYMQKHEVTLGEFAAFIKSTNYVTTAERKGYSTVLSMGQANIFVEKRDVCWRHDSKGQLLDSAAQDIPVVHVSFEDALQYCNWLSDRYGLARVYEITGQESTADWEASGFRLPTEAEWEFAAREGGKMRRYGNGKNVADPREINFDGYDRYPLENAKAGIRRNKAMPVGSLPPNKLDLYDLSGNVSEWCWDWYDENYYSQSPSKNPKGPSVGRFQDNANKVVNGTLRTKRGGSFESPASGVRCSQRGFYHPDYSSGILGFRIVKNK